MARDVFSVSRSAFEHPLLSGERFTRFQMWLWILSSASWKARRARLGGRSLRLVDLKRGEFLTTIRDLADKSRWSKDTVRRFLDALIAEDMISAHPDTGGTLIRVCNYETYQLKPRDQAPAQTFSQIPDQIPVQTPAETRATEQGFDTDPVRERETEPDACEHRDAQAFQDSYEDIAGTDAGRVIGHPYIRNTENTADTGKTENACFSVSGSLSLSGRQEGVVTDLALNNVPPGENVPLGENVAPAANVPRLEHAKKPLVPGKALMAGEEAQRAFDAYCAFVNDLNAERGPADQLSCPQTLNGTRRAALKARLADCGGFSGWQSALEEVRRSSYLLGRRNDYRVTLDSLLGRKLFTKLMEGGFRDGDTRRVPAFYDAIDRAI